MFNSPAITWALTAVLLLGGIYYLLQAARSRHLMDRVNNSFHALMMVLMAAMLWNLAPSTVLAQIAVLAGAALWFVIQAVARPEFKLLCAGSQGRLKCVYHSLTMGAAALMIAMMDHAATGGHDTAPATAMPASTAHHGTASAAHSPAAPGLDHSADLAVPLTVFFAVAAVFFIVLLLRYRPTKPAHHSAHTPNPSRRAEHGLEALGAAAMALMFATMSA
ncbi:DUF5134 domain-containing protein [Pseudarthrobacter sp. RMG13]|uniref:DUF5134 domain-containing protein n=1 Tax=Pseudarthrobacter humi TaxID=2952523 RepID=A0ABT1LU40_9MICC|nr:DUF5134 domain-containing protein [Pseudarthrobacter humi]MCP9001989.1 DUF5134 domain-containing protein [Pseudarthrobacter humi]